jgi:hypothetical protein
LIHFRSLSDALLFTLVISGPATLWESLWRGVPMIDQRGHLWIVPAVMVFLAFFVGGAIAGRHRRRRRGAVIQALALAVPVVVALMLADLARRLILHSPLYAPYIDLWIDALVLAIVIAISGALTGRLLFLRRQRRASLTTGRTLSRYAQDGA